jgi:hypothetical protein
MLKKLVMTAVALSMSASLYAGINFDNPKTNDLKEGLSDIADLVPAPAVPSSDMKAAEKEWTIMVYINGKNNLEEFALKDVNEMEMIGSSDKVNVVVEIGRIAGHDSSDGDWKTSRRYLVQKDNNTRKITSPMIRDLGKVDMGDFRHVIGFGNWAKAMYPAKKYMFIMWNHGSGWEKSRILDIHKGISYDDEFRSHVTTPQLGLALKGIGGVNVYGSDACLMQMPEVDYELMANAEYIVGSEETEPGDGYTYNTFLAPIVKNPAMTPEQLGKAAVDAYANHYQAIKEGSTQSLIKTSALPGYLAAVNDFVAAAMASGEKALVKTAISDAQSFAIADNKDLWHFLQLYAAGSKNAGVKAKAGALQNYLLKELVLHNRVTTSEHTNAKGLSVYMPGYGLDPAYNSLAWAEASQWDEFINWYTADK